MAEVVYTKNAPDAIGPYSQAMKVGNLVFTSGQIAINPATGNVEATTIEEQTHQVCKNLTNVLEAAGTSIGKAVKTVCFLKNMSDFGAFNGVYGEYFTSKPVYYWHSEKQPCGCISVGKPGCGIVFIEVFMSGPSTQT